MESKQSNLAEVTVQLLTSGKYKWTITLDFPIEDREEALQRLKNMDTKMRELFPAYPVPGSGRVSQIEDD